MGKLGVGDTFGPQKSYGWMGKSQSWKMKFLLLWGLDLRFLILLSPLMVQIEIQGKFVVFSSINKTISVARQLRLICVSFTWFGDWTSCQNENFFFGFWHNSLATPANLFQRQLSDSDSCPICFGVAESLHHLFKDCPLALEAWAFTDIMVPDIASFHRTFRDWLMHAMHFFASWMRVEWTVLVWVTTLLARIGLYGQLVMSRSSAGLACATVEVLQQQIKRSKQQHLVFTQDVRAASQHVVDGGRASPGFFYANIGRQKHGTLENLICV